MRKMLLNVLISLSAPKLGPTPSCCRGWTSLKNEGGMAKLTREIFIDFRNEILHRYANNLKKLRVKAT
jgi:hypothetical protein